MSEDTQAEINEPLLFEIYKTQMTQMQFEITQIHSSLKFYLTILTFFFSASLTSLYFFINYSKDSKEFLLYISLCLTIIVFVFSYVGWKEQKRGYDRYLKNTYTLLKTREKLGLHKKMKFDTYSKEEYLFPDEWIIPPKELKDAFVSYENYKKYYFKFKEDAFIGHIKNFFYLFGILAIIIFFAVIILIAVITLIVAEIILIIVAYIFALQPFAKYLIILIENFAKYLKIINENK